MFPYLEIGALKLPMYGIMMLVGATLTITLAVLRAKKRDIVQAVDVFLCSVITMCGGLIGARLLYFITKIPELVINIRLGLTFSEFFSMYILKGGLVFYGGLLGGILTAAIYCRIYRIRLLDYGDEALIFLPIAHAFGRIGCFFAGCCYGRPCEAPLGVVFADSIGGAPKNIAVLPVQLYEAGFNFILFAVLILVARKQHKRGFMTGLYLLCYAIFRFAIEYLRYDTIRGIWLGLSTSQWISIGLIPFAILLMCGVFAGRKPKVTYDWSEDDNA